MSQPVSFTTPVGRLVAGSLYKEKTTDMSGRPLQVKSGPNVGQPRKEWFFALAVPKGAEAAHGPLGWMATTWGALIRQVGEQFVPNAAAIQSFAWKIIDGDSQLPNQVGRKPCDNEGWPGHWVVRFSSGFAPKLFTLIGQPANQPAAVLQADAINLGDYVQVAGSVGANEDRTKPGVFLNHNMVCHIAFGERIVVGPDVTSAGFGGQPLPAGASLTPPAGFTPPVAAGVPPAIPGAHAAPAAIAPPAPAVSTPALPIVPNPAFLQPPAATAVPPVPQPPAAPVRKLTAAANGASYEQLIAAGWTDAALVQNGLMLAA